MVDPPDRDEITTEMTAGSGPSFDVGGGLLFRRQFFVGVAGSRFSDAQPATVAISASHPQFHPPLTASGETEDLERSGSRVDLQFGYVVPNTGKFQVLLIESTVEERTVTNEFDAGGLQVAGGIRFRF